MNIPMTMMELKNKCVEIVYTIVLNVQIIKFAIDVMGKHIF